VRANIYRKWHPEQLVHKPTRSRILMISHLFRYRLEYQSSSKRHQKLLCVYVKVLSSSWEIQLISNVSFQLSLIVVDRSDNILYLISTKACHSIGLFHWLVICSIKCTTRSVNRSSLEQPPLGSRAWTVPPAKIVDAPSANVESLIEEEGSRWSDVVLSSRAARPSSPYPPPPPRSRDHRRRELLQIKKNRSAMNQVGNSLHGRIFTCAPPLLPLSVADPVS
jgi:hypothetical protein